MHVEVARVNSLNTFLRAALNIALISGLLLGRMKGGPGVSPPVCRVLDQCMHWADMVVGCTQVYVCLV